MSPGSVAPGPPAPKLSVLGLPAAVEDSYTLGSTDGPVTSVKIRCPQGHWFSGPVCALTVTADAAPSVAVPARVSPR